MEISVKELAKQLGVTTAAVHNQLKRHDDELAGHYHKVGRVVYVDDMAQSIIKDNSLHKAETEVLAQSLADELQSLRQENRELHQKIEDLLVRENALLEEKARTAPLLAQNAADNETLKKDNKQLSTVNAKLLTEAEEREQALTEAEEENAKLREQLQRMESSSLWERITKHWKE